MNKKILIMLGSLLLLIIVILSFIFFVKSRQNSAATPPVVNAPVTNPTNPSPATPTPTQTPTKSASNSPQKASDTAVISPILSYDGQSVWYFTSNGHLYTINLLSGLKQEYLLPSQLQVSNVIWPSIGNDFIIETDGSGSKTFTYYNSQQKQYLPYPANVKEVAFLSDGLHVVYQWDNGDGSTSLSMANPDLTNHKFILKLPDADDVLAASPVGNRVFAWKANASEDGKLYYINLSSPKLITLKTAADHQAKWSPDGQHFVYEKMPAVPDQSSAILYYGDIVAGSDDSLGISANISKTAFDATGKNIYVAVSGSGSSGDSFWRISTSTYQKTQISAATSYNSSNLIISNDGAKLFFVNSKDNYLYLLPITQ